MLFKKKKERDVKELDNIIAYSQRIIKNIRNKLNLDYALVLYEEMIFFYCLDTFRIIKLKNCELLHQQILNLIFRTYEHTQGIKYQENKDLIHYIYSRRLEHYAALMRKNNNNIDAELFDSIFNYQTELFATIQIKKTFSDFDPLSESNKNSCIFDTDHFLEIKKVLAADIDIILEFLNN